MKNVQPSELKFEHIIILNSTVVALPSLKESLHPVQISEPWQNHLIILFVKL